MTWNELSNALSFGSKRKKSPQTKKKIFNEKPLLPVEELAKQIYLPEWKELFTIGDNQQWNQIVERAKVMQENIVSDGGKHISLYDCQKLVVAEWQHGIWAFKEE